MYQFNLENSAKNGNCYKVFILTVKLTSDSDRALNIRSVRLWG